MTKKQKEAIARLLKLLGTKEQIMKMLETLPPEVFNEVIELAINLIEEEA